MNKEKLKKLVFLEIEKNADAIIGIGEKIKNNPEMGYKEHKTAALVKEELSRLGMSVRDTLAETGVKAKLCGGSSDITVAVMGELDASAKVDRAIEGASYAIGAKAEIRNYKGYLPLIQNEALSAVFEECAKEFIPEDKIYHGYETAGSSDVGDLSHLIPTIQPTMGGYFGSLHSKEFKISDVNTAYIIPAKIMAATVIELLVGDAECAKRIKAEFKPILTKEKYIKI